MGKSTISMAIFNRYGHLFFPISGLKKGENVNPDPPKQWLRGYLHGGWLADDTSEHQWNTHQKTNGNELLNIYHLDVYQFYPKFRWLNHLKSSNPQFPLVTSAISQISLMTTFPATQSPPTLARLTLLHIARTMEDKVLRPMGDPQVTIAFNTVKCSTLW